MTVRRAEQAETIPAPQVRVLQSLWRLGDGGVSTWLLQLLERLDRRRFHVDVLLLDGTRGRTYSAVEALGCRVLLADDWQAVSHARRFAALVRAQGGYDVVHSHLGSQSGLVMRSAHLAGVPVRIAHSRNSVFAREQGLRGRLYSAASRHWILSHATHLLAVSQAAGEALFGPGAVADHRFRLNHTALDLRAFRSSPPASVLRAQFGLPPGAPVIVHVGRFRPQKNHRFLVEIARELLPRRPETVFLLIGDGPLRPAVEEQVATLGLNRSFRFAGSRDDVPQLLAGVSDLLIFPSVEEGLGRVAVEAQAAGVPCLLSSGVPAEASVVPALVSRLGLDVGAAAWAARACALLDAPRPLPATGALATVERSPFNIEAAVRELQQIWSCGPL